MLRRLALLCLALALALTAVSTVREGRRPSADFATRYAGGVATAHGQDAYDDNVLFPIERRLVGPYDYGFRDPPPVAWGFRVLAAIPYRAANVIWFLVALLSAFACAALALRLTSLPPRGAVGWGIAALVALDFAPLREGVANHQLDPFIGALALAAFAAASRPGAGLVQAVATMKPQAALLATAGHLDRGRLRFAAWLVLGWALLFGATVAADPPSWRAWVTVVHHANRSHSAAAVLAGIAVAVVAVVLAVVGARGGGPVRVLAAAALVNGAIGPLVFLNPQSDVLVLVALLVLAQLHPPAVPFGAIVGVFSLAGLFAVRLHSGLSHALVPVAIAGLVALFVALRWPQWRLAAATAFAVNAAITLPSFHPHTHDLFGVAASLVGLALLAGQRHEVRRVPGLGKRARIDAGGQIDERTVLAERVQPVPETAE
jgi:hypothetical protein